MKQIQLHNCDNLELMKSIKDESIDVICIDPPYLYLKNQKLERAFDEPKFFLECYRVLQKNGFIIMFGRGESFYRWNYLLSEMVLKKDKTVDYSFQTDIEDIRKRNLMNFKEEIVWNKSHCTSPLMRLSRVHETVSIFTKGKGTINKVKVPYFEMKSHDLDSVIGDVKRMRSILKNTKSLDAVLSFLESNNVPMSSDNVLSTSVSSVIKTQDRCASVMNQISNGLNEKSIINLYDYNSEDRVHNDKHNVVASPKLKNGDRCVYVMSNIIDGLNEKSIIKQVRDHYSAIHPTQKPVRLLERLLALVIPKDKEPKDIVVADFFGGSMSTMEAVYNMGMQGIACEIDQEYFDLGKERIENLKTQQKLF